MVIILDMITAFSFKSFRVVAYLLVVDIIFLWQSRLASQLLLSLCEAPERMSDFILTLPTPNNATSSQHDSASLVVQAYITPHLSRLRITEGSEVRRQSS